MMACPFSLRPTGSTLACLTLLVALRMAVSPSFSPGADSAPAGSAEEKAVAFLASHTLSWPEENGCFSCHNNGDAARALHAARKRGLRLDSTVLAETNRWLLSPDRWDENKGRKEFGDQRLAALQFTSALEAAIDGGLDDGLAAFRKAAGMVASTQDDDGSWRFDNAGATGSPITYGAFLATATARRILHRADSRRYAPHIERADRYLLSEPVHRVLDAAAVVWHSAQFIPANEDLVRRRRECVRVLLEGESEDGGWGPFVTSAPEPFDTAVVVLALDALQDDDLRAPAARGRRFLVRSQRSDGSWPATTRPPGADSYPQMISTTAWATLALVTAGVGPTDPGVSGKRR